MVTNMTNIAGEPPFDQTFTDTVIQASTMSVIILLTVFCNGLVLVAFYQHKLLQTFTNAFVVNLAVADFCYGVLVMPFSLITSVTIDWILGDFMCQYHGFMNVLFCEASIWTLTFVSFERYLVIRHPFHHQRFVTPNIVAAAIVMVWVIAVVFACLPFGLSRFVFMRFKHACIVDWRVSIRTTLTYSIISVFVPFSFMCLCNIGVLKTAFEQKRKVKVNIGNINREITVDGVNTSEVGTTIPDAETNDAERATGLSGEREISKNRRRLKETRATILVLVIIGSFAICWMPYTITTFCLMVKGHACPWSSRAFVTSAWLTGLNSALNPILYVMFNVTFRRAVKQVLGIRSANNGDSVAAGVIT